jgi:hypothetical protein
MSGEEITPRAKARYEVLKSGRNTILERARTNSDLTIPGLVPTDGQSASTSFSQPYQSLGARCVNNLAAWMLVTQFPPDAPFARISVHEDTAAELGERLSEVQTALARIASRAHLRVETMAMRPIMMEAFRHLVVAGNALIHIPLENVPPRMWRLDQYVVLRDERGRLIEAVVHEQVYAATLSEEVRTACDVQVEPGKEKEKMVDLYTHVTLDGEDLVDYQQINEKIVPGSEGKAPRDRAGWMALRWQAVPGTDYGRAHVSEYIGDLMSLEDLSKAIIQFAAVASRIVHIVDPNSMIDVEELNRAETGEYITGYVDKVQSLQLEKSQDFQVASNVAERLELRLSHAFMLQSGTVRNAERVTAEEIRAMAQELENVLGGVYTVMSAELQLPLIRRLLYALSREQKVPELPDDVEPTIVTGFEALGRNHAANKLRMWLTDMKTTYGDAVVAQITDSSEVGRRLADSYGIEDVASLIKGADQLAAENEAAQAQQATQAAVPHLAKAGAAALAEPQG